MKFLLILLVFIGGCCKNEPLKNTGNETAVNDNVIRYDFGDYICFYASSYRGGVDLYCAKK